MSLPVPLVSAICPTFNRPRFLARAVQLFEAQVYPNKELIIVDDSNPPAAHIDRPGVVHLHLPTRLWTVPKYQHAFAVAKGELVCTFDDDDWHSPYRLGNQVLAMVDDSLDACGYHVDTMVSLPGPRFMRWKKETLDRWARQVLNPVPFHDGSAMWSASWLTRLPKETWEGTQISWFNAIRANGGKLAGLDNDGYFLYVRHPHCGWSFEVDELCEPWMRPRCVTNEMMEFWSDPRLLKEGEAA